MVRNPVGDSAAYKTIFAISLIEITLAAIGLVNVFVIFSLYFISPVEDMAEMMSLAAVAMASIATFLLAWRARNAESRAWILFYPWLFLKSLYFTGVAAQFHFYIGCAYYVFYDNFVGLKGDFVLGGQFGFSTDPPLGLVQFGVNVISLALLFAAVWARPRVLAEIRAAEQ